MAALETQHAAWPGSDARLIQQLDTKLTNNVSLCQLLYADSETVPGADVRVVQTRLRGAIDRIRTLDLLKDIPILFIAENAPGILFFIFLFCFLGLHMG